MASGYWRQILPFLQRRLNSRRVAVDYVVAGGSVHPGDLRRGRDANLIDVHLPSAIQGTVRIEMGRVRALLEVADFVGDVLEVTHPKFPALTQSLRKYVPRSG